MLFDHIADIAGSRKKIMAGFELGRSYAQVSYIGPGMDKPETAATITGTQIYNIPTVLCKRIGVNQWYYGRSAEKMSGSDQVIKVDHLLDRARNGESVEVDGERFDPSALLTLFIKRALSILTFVCSVEDLDSIMFTVESLDDRMIGIFGGIVKNLGLDKTKIYFQDYAESIFHYMMYQPEELWKGETISCLYDGETVHIYKMDRNIHTTPIVVLISEEVSEGMILPESKPGDDNSEAFKELDRRFDGFIEAVCKGSEQSSFYLLGDGFKEKWMDVSLKSLCSGGRRVFQGNNMFSIGACCCLMDKKNPCENAGKHIYLGRDKLKSNVGMNVFVQGREEYHALLDAGTNWYDAQCESDIILGDDPTVSVIVTPLDGQRVHTEVLTLRNIPDRPTKTTRIHMTVTMKSIDDAFVEMKDMGFGELYPASDEKWQFEVKLTQ